MENLKLQVEIVEYNKRYASLEDVKRIFITNFAQHMNSNNFTGVYLSMLGKYGKFTYIIMLAPALLIFSIFCLLFSYTTALNSKTMSILLSIVIAIAVEYVIFGHYLVKKIQKCDMGYGYEMLQTFNDIDEKYRKNGGNFWLALVHNSATGKTEVVGQVGLLNSTAETSQPLQKVGLIEALSVDEKYRGIGIGKKLLETVIKYAQVEKYDMLKLGLLAINFTAINLYKKYGFKEGEIEEVEPLTGLCGFFMTKQLH